MKVYEIWDENWRYPSWIELLAARLFGKKIVEVSLRSNDTYTFYSWRGVLYLVDIKYATTKDKCPEN